LKKLIFAPFFLIILGLFFYQLTPLLESYDFIFSLSSDTLIQLITISAFVSLSSLLFTVFATIASSWKLVLPVVLIGAIISLVFLPMPLGLIFVAAIFVSLLLTYVSLDNALKSYLTFQPSTLLGPSIKHLSGFLILSFCLVFFLTTSRIIAQNGFQIPDTLIDTALKMTPLPTEQAQLPTINPDQLELLKQNPNLLKQSGLDPKILDTLNQAPADLIKDTIKQTVKDQIQGFIKPYQSFIPAILAVLLFLTLQSLTSILNLLVPPLLWLIFLILEKTGFIKFETEQRTVKKMVV
ncbi:MAG: hypothetical protein Q7R77_03605, partial [Candidatus Daviesbacteria bacterium]|nr:hypothetical protein [Candidatus Daviesbacteria bacterium]